MECPDEVKIVGSHLFCEPSKGFIRVLGRRPMGLPMIRPFCNCINKYLRDVKSGDWLSA
jgi:hypothetical protein